MAARLSAAACLLAALPALAQLADPTRPPTASPETMSSPAAAPAARLQSVLIAPGRKVAVIDGRTVKLGERIGDARVVAISPAQVTLQKGAERQTLQLHPGIEKKP